MLNNDDIYNIAFKINALSEGLNKISHLQKVYEFSSLIFSVPEYQYVVKETRTHTLRIDFLKICQNFTFLPQDFGQK